MKPPPFEYVRAGSLDEALGALAERRRRREAARRRAEPRARCSTCGSSARRCSSTSTSRRARRVATRDGALASARLVRQAALADDVRGAPAAARVPARTSATSSRATAERSAARSPTPTPRPSCRSASSRSAGLSSPIGRERPARDRRRRLLRHALHDGARAGRARRRDASGRCAGAARRSRSRSSRCAHGDYALAMARCVLRASTTARSRRPGSRSAPSPTGRRRSPRSTALLDGSRGAERRAAKQVALAARLVDPPDALHASDAYLRHLTGRARRAGRARAWRRDGGVTEVEVDGQRSASYREAVEPRLLLTDFLRHRSGLTGTHVGCEHGVCGACTVLLDGVAVRGCCLLAVQADGSRDRDGRGLAAAGALPAPGGVPPTTTRCSAASARPGS